MSQPNLSELENDRYPTSSFTPRLAETLKVSSIWLAEGRGQREAVVMPMNEHSDVGRQIQEALKRSGHTQDWLAEACDVSSNAVSKWIKTGRVSRDNIPKVCKQTGLSPAIFIGMPPAQTEAVQADGALRMAQSLRRMVAAIAREWGVDPADLTDPSDEALERVRRAIEQAQGAQKASCGEPPSQA